MAKRISVVISQGQSPHPAKRQLEEDLITRLMFEPGIDVTVVPHLYDLKTDGTGMLALQGVKGDLVVCSWLFSRAAFWVLDRSGIRGRMGVTLLVPDEEDEEELEEELDASGTDKDRVSDRRDLPDRTIWTLDLKVKPSVDDYIEEIKRIATLQTTKTYQLAPPGPGVQPAALERYHAGVERPLVAPVEDSTNGSSNGSANRVDAGDGKRRWYPVIDFSRCTNCMECIDFCLFGVYGVDTSETILVEQPDNCRKGCPACSRVCPENAIMFPQHKTPAIAGAPVGLVGLKIDLSKLFGAPEEGKSAEEIAALERDEQLVMAGRDAVGMSVGIRKRQEGKSEEPRDELDDLIDGLDELDF